MIAPIRAVTASAMYLSHGGREAALM
jgi:hypothetical protein